MASNYGLLHYPTATDSSTCRTGQPRWSESFPVALRDPPGHVEELQQRPVAARQLTVEAAFALS